MVKKLYDSLGIPPAAQNHGGFEVMRAAMVGENLAMSLRRLFDDPAAWGALLATAARQIAVAYGRETQFSEAAARERIREIFLAEMDSTEAPGTITVVR